MGLPLKKDVLGKNEIDGCNAYHSKSPSVDAGKEDIPS